MRCWRRTTCSTPRPSRGNDSAAPPGTVHFPGFGSKERSACRRRIAEYRPEASRSARRNRMETIMHAVFNSNQCFPAEPAERLGMTARIRFAVAACSLGAILVAASDRGIVAILLGDDHDTLLRALRKRFPKTRLVGGGEDFDPIVAKVVDFVEAPSP